MRRGLIALSLFSMFASACGVLSNASAEIRIGVMLPMSDSQSGAAREELNGIEVAVDEANRRGGVQGRSVKLLTRDVTTREGAVAAAHELRSAGAQMAIGTYSSALSVAAAHATSYEGMVYWESGAVADQVTGDGLPLVFRVGASGANLGRGSATFAAEQLAPRLGKSPTDLTVAVVYETDDYGSSVAGAAIAEAARRNLRVVDITTYDARRVDVHDSGVPSPWDPVFSRLKQDKADVIILASYVADGVDFRREMVARGLHAGALIGSTMAECGPEFGRELGADAIGVFASDRPTRGFNPSALGPAGKAAYSVLTRDYAPRFNLQPAEEAISGFSAAWALLFDVLPAAKSLDREGIAIAARAMDLPMGALPNGGGLRFSDEKSDLGQNLRAASVVWQWQGVRQSVTVWPAVFSTGQIRMVPLPA